MIETLKQVLREGVQRALASQVEHTNKSFILQGKGEAFQEVLMTIETLEAQAETNDKDTAPKRAKKKTKK
jgi:hypothetical protein